jgi:hypothetical protein
MNLTVESLEDALREVMASETVYAAMTYAAIARSL